MESSKASRSLFIRILVFCEQLKFHAQLSMKKVLSSRDLVITLSITVKLDDLSHTSSV